MSRDVSVAGNHVRMIESFHLINVVAEPNSMNVAYEAQIADDFTHPSGQPPIASKGRTGMGTARVIYGAPQHLVSRTVCAELAIDRSRLVIGAPI